MTTLHSHGFFLFFQERSDTIDLSDNSTLLVDISDALSERDKVKFTVHTKVSWQVVHFVYFLLTVSLLFCQSSLPDFKKTEFSVVRQHEEFIWLHNSLVDNEEYGGYIVRF